MNFCLSDLVPPLRWSDASTITLLTGQPDLPDAWWRSLPMPRVLAAIGPESLGELLTEIALEHWPAAAVGDVLPALYVLDPDEADEPAVAIALDRAGSWAGLLALTSRELVDQPFIQARPVLNTLFSAALVRLAHPRPSTSLPRPDSAATPAEVVATPAEAAVTPAEAVVTPEAVVAPAEAAGAPGARVDLASAPEVAPVEPADPDPHPAAVPAPTSHGPAVSHEAEAAVSHEFAPEDDDSPEPDAASSHEDIAHEGVSREGVAHEGVAHEDIAHEAHEAHEGEIREGEAGETGTPEVAFGAGRFGTDEEPVSEVEDREDEPVPDADLRQVLESESQPVLDADSEPVFEEERRAESAPVLDAADEPAPEPAAEEAAALQAEGIGQAPEPPIAEPLASEPAPSESVAPAFAAAVGPDDRVEPGDAEAVEEADAHHHVPVDQVERGEAGVHGEPGQDDEHDQPFGPVEHEQAFESDEAVQQDEHEVSGEDGRPREGAGPELAELIEAAFAGLDDKSWAVAQNRIFTDQPSAVDQLAKLFAVPPADISATENELRIRLDQWLASEEAAPYRAHLDELRKTLGPAAPKEQLIGAAEWHAREIRALEVPAWQFVLATLPTQAGSQAGSRPEGRPDSQAGGRPESWPESQAGGQAQGQPEAFQQAELPQAEFPQGEFPQGEFQQHSAFGPVQVPPPPPPPGPPQFQAFMPVAPPAGEANGGGEQNKPYQPLKDVSQTRRCFRQPDGRWWLRIDVTAEQLAGGECALPTGFAAYLGLSPGETRAVRSAAGELTMTWHGRPVLESIERLLVDVGAKEGGHLFLTLSDEGVLRARHLPVAAQNAENITKALRLVGYTAPGGTRDQAARVIATRIGLTGPVGLPDLLTRLRERGDRDLLALLD